MEASTSREWWLANGIGGYASGTLSGVLTRRYHGLLVAPPHPPLGRFLLFAKADAVLLDGERATPLHTNRWGDGAVAPEGYRHIEDFRVPDGVPTWRFAVNDLRVEQRIWMTQGENRTQVAFRLLDGTRSEAPRIRPDLVASFRDHHGVNHPGAFQIEKEVLQEGLRLHLPGDHFLHIHSEAGSFGTDDTWIERFFLSIEHERGLEDIDAHLRVGFVDLPLARDAWVGIDIGLDTTGRADPGASLAAERQRIAELQLRALPGVEGATVPSWIRQLVTAADDYILRRREAEGRRNTTRSMPPFGTTPRAAWSCWRGLWGNRPPNSSSCRTGPRRVSPVFTAAAMPACTISSTGRTVSPGSGWSP